MLGLSGHDIDFDLFVRTLVTVVVIMDPLGGVPVFIVLTKHRSQQARRRDARLAVGLAACVILGFAAFGDLVLRVLGISFPALQVAGGLLLALVALELLGSSEPPPSSRATNPALVPLGTPLLAGPGAIAATMLSIRSAESGVDVIGVVLALICALAFVYLALRFAGPIGRLLRPSALDVVTRIMGLLATAIAVEFVADGVAGLVRSR